MRRVSSLVPVSLSLLILASGSGQADEQRSAQRDAALRAHALDPASSLESRVATTPASVLKMFADAGMGSPTPHALTDAERRQLDAAVAALPPAHRRILGDRLRTISFLDGMPNTALTSTVNPSDPYRLFDITVRASVLRESASAFLTAKEQTCFEADGSPVSVSIDAGTLDALVYVLLHEATHVVDNSIRLTPAAPAAPGESTPAHPFTDGIWSDRLTFAPRYRDALLERVKFRAKGEAFPLAQAGAVYAALERTPFVSLYGSSNWHDDVAEIATWYHLTERMGQPYRIVIRTAGKETAAYTPMQSRLVRARFDAVRQFYGDLG